MNNVLVLVQRNGKVEAVDLGYMSAKSGDAVASGVLTRRKTRVVEQRKVQLTGIRTRLVIVAVRED